MEPLLIGALVLVVLLVGWRLFGGKKSPRERLEALDPDEIMLVPAVLLKKDALGYIVRSGTEHPDDPEGYRVHLRLDAPAIDVEGVQTIRPSEAEQWGVGSVHLLMVARDDPTLWIVADPDLYGPVGEDAVEVTTLHFAAPLSLSGMNSPHPWLLPSKTDRQVVVIDINDAHQGDASRDMQLTNLAILLAEEIACRTDAHGSSVSWLSEARGKLIETTSDDATHEAQIKSWIAQEDHEQYIVVAGTTVGSDELTLRFTIQGGGQVRRLTCHALEASERIREELESFGVRSAEPPQWFQPMPTTDLGIYQSHLGILAILMVQNYGMLAAGDWLDEVNAAIEMAARGGRWRALALALSRAHLKEHSDESAALAFVEDTLRLAPFQHLWPCFDRADGEELWRTWRERVSTGTTLEH